MNDPCPHCGLIFQREEGYFLGAMYVSYTLGCFMVAGGFFLGSWLKPDLGDLTIIAVVVGCYLVTTPWVFRYSRIIWMYFDRWDCCGDTSAGPYEKARAIALTAKSGQGAGRQPAPDRPS
jgi:hypothetical protein